MACRTFRAQRSDAPPLLEPRCRIAAAGADTNVRQRLHRVRAREASGTNSARSEAASRRWTAAASRRGADVSTVHSDRSAGRLFGLPGSASRTCSSPRRCSRPARSWRSSPRGPGSAQANGWRENWRLPIQSWARRSPARIGLRSPVDRKNRSRRSSGTCSHWSVARSARVTSHKASRFRLNEGVAGDAPGWRRGLDGRM